MNIGKDKTYKLAGNPCGAGREGVESVLEVTVSYSLGGANYWQGTQEKRGYWLHVSPIGIERHEGFTSKCFTIGSGPKGYKAFLFEVKRRTVKGDEQAIVLAAAKERDLIEKVLAAGGLVLAGGVELPAAPLAVPALPSGTIKDAPKPAPISAGQTWLTKEERERLPAMDATSAEEDPVAQVKYFDPSGSWTWYGVEFDPKEERFYGLVVGAETELGYFTLAELREVRGRMGLGVERDRHFKPARLSEITNRTRCGIPPKTEADHAR